MAVSTINVGNSGNNRAAAPKFHLEDQREPLLMQRLVAERRIKPCGTVVLHVYGGIDAPDPAAAQLLRERTEHPLADAAIARRRGDIDVVELGDDAAYRGRDR